jgi:hypothetical protein
MIYTVISSLMSNELRLITLLQICRLQQSMLLSVTQHLQPIIMVEAGDTLPITVAVGEAHLHLDISASFLRTLGHSVKFVRRLGTQH